MDMKTKILIVDDSRSACELLRGVLEPEGYELAVAMNGEEALKIAPQFKPDLVLLDVIMPGMSGYEVCERLRSNPELSAISVIFLTSLEDRDSRLKSMEAGGEDVLTKPFDVAELLLRVRNIANLDRYKRLDAAERRFEWVIEEAEDGYIMLDAKDFITYANPKASHFLGGAGAESLLGKPFLYVAGKNYHMEPENAWNNWAGSNVCDPSPLYLVKPETLAHHASWLQIHCHECQVEGVKQRLIRLRDVTKDMGNFRDTWTFQSMITHKLRTPLSGVLFSMEVLNGDDVEWPSEGIKQMAQMGAENVKRLNRAIEDILQFLEAPLLASGQEAFDTSGLQSLLADLADHLEMDIPSLSIDQESAGAELALSESAVERIFRILMENAKKFHPDNAPTIEIAVEQAKAGKVKITVKDNGRHLPPAMLDRVWTPFFQGEKNVTYEVDGMGLGLPNLAVLVWNVGGACRLFNRQRQDGLVVELVIPLKTIN